MDEIFRFLQQRQTQKLSDEQKQLVGLPLYPEPALSDFATGLRDGTDSEEKYNAVIAKYKKNNYKDIITDTKKINPVIRSIYDWLNFKARPLKIEDFKKLIDTIDKTENLDIRKEWTLYADNLLLAVDDKNISINYCVDFQLLIRICYLFILYLDIRDGKIILKENLRGDHLNSILDTPVLLPALLLRSRCSGGCSQKGKVAIPGKETVTIKEGDKSPCECTCNENCQAPDFHCICVNTYVSDLFIIKEDLARYEAGDIADIENILAGEKKVRYHRNLYRTEDTTETENETTTSDERDHQVNEKFSLQSEVKNTIDTRVGLDAGVTATIKYGKVATITPHANVTASYAKSQSESTARSYAKDITDKSVTTIQEKVRKLQISKIITEEEERNKHSIDNTQVGNDHRAGIYYWVNKVTHAQVFNYGKHLMFDLVLPEPAALFKKLYQEKINSDKNKNEPSKPVVIVNNKATSNPLTPLGIDRTNYGGILSFYGIASTEEINPPEPHTAVQFAFAQNFSEQDPGKTTGFSSSEFKSPQIPDGYKASRMNYEINCSTGHPKATSGDDELAVTVNVGKYNIFRHSLNEFKDGGGKSSQNWWGPQGSSVMDGEEGILTLAVAGFSTLGLALSGTVSIICDLKPATLESWQAKIFNIVMADYNRKLDAYNASNNKNDELVQIKGRNPFLNREIERNELKRHIIALLMCNYFNGMGSMMEKVAPCGYPEINFSKLEKDAPVIQFFEQVFEWNYITYLFYHSMWARKCKWVELIDSDSGDALFDKFLMAGASRVQIPVRPGMEELAAWFLKTGQIWGASGVPPVSGDDDYVSMIQELKESKQCDYTDRPGFIAAINGNAVLKLTDSTFYWDFVNDQPNQLVLDNDIDRELLVNYKLYRIVSVKQTSAGDNTAWDITIERGYEDTTTQNLKHGVGALFVGAPWEIVIPTKLVYLRNKTDKLPVYPLGEL